MKSGGVLVVLVAALAWVASASASPAVVHPPRLPGLSNSTSSNWAGYAASTGHGRGDLTSVSASWNVPEATCAPGENSSSAFWVGLDGYSSSSVEQIGTSSDCVDGEPTYSAWYEMYPKASVPLSLAVTQGQTVLASVTETGKGMFTLSITVGSHSVSPVTATFRGAKTSSAEAIAEAPSYHPGPFGQVPLTQFDPVTFSSVTVNGRDIGYYTPDEITMEQGGTTKAYPSSPLTGGTYGNTFTVTWGAPPS